MNDDRSNNDGTQEKSRLGWVVDLDFAIYGGLALLILSYITFRIGRGLFESRQFAWLFVYGAVLLLSLGAAIRDVKAGTLGWASRTLLGAWGLVVVVLVVVDLASTFAG